MPAPLLDLLGRGAGRGAVIDDGTGGPTVPLSRLLAASERLAGGLAGWGLVPGDRAAVVLPHGPDWYLVHLALARLGVLTVPVSTRLAAPEIDDLVRSARCRLVVVDPGFLGLGLDRVAARLSRSGAIDRVLTTAPTTVPGARELDDLDGMAPAVAGDGASAPLVCFGTSGTTGAPKLAVHTHDGVAGHVAAVADATGLTGECGGGRVVLGALPPCGAYGYTLAMAALAAGCRLVTVPTFTPTELFDLVATHRVEVVAVTEAILRAALAAGVPHPGGHWRLAASAGGSLADVAATLERDGTRVVNVYGASEVLALLAVRDPSAAVPERAAAGGTIVGEQAAARAEVRAVVPGTDTLLPAGQDGELQFRGPSVFTGYLDSPAATAAALGPGGWYRSGDSGRVESGGAAFDYLARLSDTLRLKGFLVDPGQIEEVLLAHPGVGEAQVVGVPDPGTDEDLAVAFVVGAAQPDELRAWCRERLAAFKIPARIEWVDDIPVIPSANGDKALRRALRERAVSLMEEDR
ncbi:MULTISPECIES: AMP-binding protein [unclassified Pseudonocardia]|uniref:AMP-binding protein n=1 Tax=unclassified Pseudonocardia TaxID=2619320 RepID=UPI000760C69C|nr:MULTISPECIES: AMP-binding protein [unclassified Pseudonocardia]